MLVVVSIFLAVISFIVSVFVLIGSGSTLYLEYQYYRSGRVGFPPSLVDL